MSLSTLLTMWCTLRWIPFLSHFLKICTGTTYSFAGSAKKAWTTWVLGCQFARPVALHSVWKFFGNCIVRFLSANAVAHLVPKVPAKCACVCEWHSERITECVPPIVISAHMHSHSLLHTFKAYEIAGKVCSRRTRGEARKSFQPCPVFAVALHVSYQTLPVHL